MSSEPAIVVDRLGKQFLMYGEPRDRLKQAIATRLAGAWNAIGIGATRQAPQYFREFWALRDVSFSVARGETMGIVGINGSGKSTLLQIICGTLSPTLGRVAARGRIAALLELGAGFNPEFTGRENVYLNGALLGLSDEEIAERFDSIAAFADIGDFIERPVKTYSSGMFVRLAFAVIAHVDADILVIDEALAVGDFFFAQKCMRFLRKFKERGTILFVSHDTGAIVNFCDRAIWLSGGQVREIGPAEHVCQSYMAGQYAQHQDTAGAASPPARGRNSAPDEPQSATPGGATLPAPSLAADALDELADQRQAFINSTNLRNDIEVFRPRQELRGFGAGGASIRSARLCDLAGRELSWIVGGEHVKVIIEADVHRPIERLVMGFFVKDRLGQILFGENTHITYADRPVSAAAGSRVRAEFGFRMPLLAEGEYAADLAIADGTQSDHIQHQWLHDALLFKAHSSSIGGGLLGLRCNVVRLDVDEPAADAKSTLAA